MALPGTEEAYRTRIEQWVESGIGRATSADALFQMLRETDYYAPRSIVRSVWAEQVRGAGYIPLIGRLSEEEYIPRSWMKATDLAYSERYVTKFQITGFSAETGEPQEKFITLEWAELPQKGAILEAASDYIYHYGFGLEPGLSEINFTSVMRR